MDNLGFSGNQDWTAGNPFLGASNPYLQQNIDSSLGDIVRNYNLAVKPQMESAMAGSGSFGNSGLQQMQQEQQRQLGSDLGRTSAAMRMQDYGNQQNMYQWDQGFNRNLYNDSFSQNQQNLQDYMGLLSTANQFNQNDLTNTTNIQNTPMNYWDKFTNTANSVGNGFASTNGTASQFYPGSPVMGALGGWQLGSAIAKNWPSGGGGWSASDGATANANGATDFMWPSS